MGAGGVGSATVYHLARRGLDALELDQYNVPSSISSSHGGSRLIRLTNHEDPEYVPHIRRSISLRESLEEEYGEQLPHHTGTVGAGSADSETVRGPPKACTDYDLPCEHLPAGELSKKFPDFEFSQKFEAVYQPDGGFINPIKRIQAHVELTQEHGATMHAHETVVDWESTTNSVAVEMDRVICEASHVVVTVGAWTQSSVEELEETLTPQRVIVGGFQPEDRSQLMTDSFPVSSIEGEQQSYYGGPTVGTSGFKFGLVDNLEGTADPNDFDPRPTEKERGRLRTVFYRNARQCLPEGVRDTKRLGTCMVTHTPDQGSIVDYLPLGPNVVVGAGFSGKGFGFGCLIDELLADLAIESDLAVDINLFDVDRFQTMPRQAGALTRACIPVSSDDCCRSCYRDLL